MGMIIFGTIKVRQDLLFLQFVVYVFLFVILVAICEIR